MLARYLLIVVGIVISVVTILWIFSDRQWKITNTPVKGEKIVAFGDSLVEGIGSTPGNDFISQTSQKVGLPIKNLGRSGDTTRSALDRLDVVLQVKPDIAIILLGGNDAIKRFPVEETESNLLTIIHKFQSVGAVTVLLGVRGGLFGSSYDKMYERIAKSTGSLYISDVLSGLFGNPQYMADTIHLIQMMPGMQK